MDKQEAREILRLHRPGTDDADEPRTAEALRLAQQDEELGRWYQNQCAVYEAMRRKLREIPVPEHLKQEILKRHGAVRENKIVELRRWFVPLAAAAIMMMLAGGWFFFHVQARLDSRSFATGWSGNPNGITE